MIRIGIKHNIAETIRLLDDNYRKQIPFATAKALTKTAQLAQKAVVDEMAAKFDRPTPFTLKSLFIKPATKQNLQAMVYLKDRPAGQNPYSLSEIIGQEFGGGVRIRKRLEYWLQRAGYISSDEFVAPGAAAKLDRYGNMSRGQVQQILSQLKAGPDTASYKSGSSRSKRNVKMAGQLFWSRGGRLPRGVWMRAGASVKPILIVISKPSYKQRINLERIVGDVVNRRFDAEFKKALGEAIRTAR
jgi:hypothetical protein